MLARLHRGGSTRTPAGQARLYRNGTDTGATWALQRVRRCCRGDAVDVGPIWRLVGRRSRLAPHHLQLTRPGQSDLVRIVILGCGFIGSVHADAIRAAGYELIGVVDADPATAERLATAHGVPWAVAPAELLDVAGAVDAVVIATPPAHHAAGIHWAVANGLAILCEKPLAPTVAEARDLEDRCRRAGVALAVGFKMRFEPIYLRVHELIRGGAIGQIRSVTASHYQRHPQKAWSSEIGVASELLVHTIDLARWILRSDPIGVSGHRTPTTARANLTFPNHVTANLTGAWLREFPDVSGYADHVLHIVGTGGHVVAIRPDLIRVVSSEGIADHVVASSDYGAPFVEQWREFANFTAHSGQATVWQSIATGTDGIATLEIIDALTSGPSDSP